MANSMKLDRENKRVHVMRNMSGVCSSCKKREYEDFSSFSFERALINSDFTDKQAQNLVPVNKIGDVYPLPPLLDFSCGVYGKSDGGVEKAKLIVGTRTINLLVTASVEIAQDPTVHVGPGVEFGSNKGRSKFWLLPKIFVRSTEQDRLVKEFSSGLFLPDPMMINVSQFRQLTTGFNKICAYKPWRRSLNGFDTTLLMPVTVFTLCSLPNNQGFGFSSSSLAAFSSQLLQLFSAAVSMNDATLRKDEIKSLLNESRSALDKKKNVKE